MKRPTSFEPLTHADRFRSPFFNTAPQRVSLLHVLVLSIAMSLPFASAVASQPADLILTGGKILNQTEEQ